MSTNIIEFSPYKIYCFFVIHKELDTQVTVIEYLSIFSVNRKINRFFEMFATDLKIISLAPKDVLTCTNDNTSPMIKYQKQQNLSQKYQNNVTHNNNNRKKLQKIPTNNACNTNKNHTTNNQSFTANNRKRINQQQLNINFHFKNNNNNTIKNQNIYIPTSVSNNIVIKNTQCSDSTLASPSIPKNCCDSFVDKNITTSEYNNVSSFQKSSSANSSSVSSSSSLSSSSSSSTSGHNSSISNKSRVPIKFGSTSTHRKKPQQTEVDIKGNKKSLSPVPPMVINTNSSNTGGSHSSSNQQMSAVFTSSNASVVSTATSVVSSSAPVSPNSYSLDFLHSVGMQMAGGIVVDGVSTGNNHIYSSSATVSPIRSVVDTQSMGMQGQRIIYQDIPPPQKEKRIIYNEHQHKYSPVTKLQSPSYNEYPSYDIPILINNPHHGVNSMGTHLPSDNFSSPYNHYPPLSNYSKRNNYIPVSYTYQKCQNESKNVQQLDNGSSGNANAMNAPNNGSTYNRNRNQVKVWNTNNTNVHITKNDSNKHLSNSSSDSGQSQIIPRVKNHQNLHNLKYVTTDPNNNNRYVGSSRSQSASPKAENPLEIRNKTKPECNCRGPFPYVNTQVKVEPVTSPSDVTQVGVASEGYESDSSNSSCGNVKKIDTSSSNHLSSSSSSTSSTDISYAHPSSVTSLLNFPTSYAEDDLPIHHFYGSEQNLSHWIPALHAQFMYSAHGNYTINENAGDLQQQQIQASNMKKSQAHRNSFRGGRGRNFIHSNNGRSIQFTNDFFFTPPDRFLARSHLVELKEMPRSLLTGTKWDNLSQAIWTRFVASQQTEDTFKRKMRLWRYLYIIIKNAYPRYGLYLVGSTISGFGADTSDIDMCLVSRAMSSIDPRMEALFNLTLLRDCLNKTGEFETFNLIEAKVPILRFRDRVHNLEVDLNFNNCVGIKNTHLLYCYSQLDWRLRPLVLVTKLWAQYHNINNAKNMTISSYSLVLMVIHFLQCAVTPPVLPCLHEMYPDKFQFILRTNDFGYVDMNETIGPYESQNTQPIGQLLLQFLQYYSTFNYSQYAISIRTGALIPIEYCRQAKSLKNDIHQWKELCIEEPFDLTNTARSVYDFETFERVKLVFMSSCRALQETLDINSIFSPIIPTATLIARPVQEH